MKKVYSFIIFFCLLFFCSAHVLFSQSFTYYKQVFKVDTLYPSTGTKGMNSAWELVYGPDDSLWVTESHNYKVWKINPNNKGSRVILDLNNSKDFTSLSVGMWPQGGLMGLAIHPQFYTGKPWVYIAYVYHVVYCAPDVCYCTNKPPCVYNTKIVRYNYNFSDGSLTVIDTVISNLNGSNDHNSGRIKISPIAESDGLYHLYYTIGDMGAGNNNNNINRTNNAQDTTIYEGKVLRLNTEPDIAQSGGAEWIPDDNPFPSNASAVLKNAIYSYGHRNPQGLAFGSSDNGATYNLYSSEHGDKSDDEVNIINPHTNYGWPKVAGLCDDNYTSTLNDSMYLASKSVINESNFCLLNHVQEPIFSFYNWSRKDTKISGSNSNNYNWPTIAPASIAFYGSSTIPGWKNSLLIPSLKNGLFRLKLKADGLSIDSASNPADTIPYFHGYRLRNIISAPTGDTLFISVDSSCCTLGTPGVINGSQVATPDMGYILRMVYLTTLPLEEYIPPPPPVTGPASVKVYPNPASNYLYVQSIKGMHKPLRAQLYDMSGKLISETITADDNFSINIKGQARGTYIFKLYSGYDIEMDTEKIVVD